MKQPLNTRIPTRAATVLTYAVCAVSLMAGYSQGSKVDSAASASAASGNDYSPKMARYTHYSLYASPSPRDWRSFGR